MTDPLPLRVYVPSAPGPICLEVHDDTQLHQALNVGIAIGFAYARGYYNAAFGTRDIPDPDMLDAIKHVAALNPRLHDPFPIELEPKED